MRRKLLSVLMCLALVVLIAGSATAFNGTYTPGAGINGTVHDLGTAHDGINYTAQPADPLQRICIFCHAPHNTYKLSVSNGGPGFGGGSAPIAPDPFDYLPLWNHQLTANFAGYTMYQNGPGAPTTGSKASQAIANGMTPGGTSLLCLSCHDGSVAVNAYGNAAQLARSISGNGPAISASYVIGKDSYLGNHHPIGFDYEAVQVADTEIRLSSQFLTPTTSIKDHLYGNGNNMMECGTCHSVHNTGNSGETLLWRSDSASKLCLTCHAKGLYTAP